MKISFRLNALPLTRWCNSAASRLSLASSSEKPIHLVFQKRCDWRGRELFATMQELELD